MFGDSMKKIHAYLYTGKNKNMDQYCMVLVNSDGVQVDSFDGEVRGSVEVKALAQLIMEYGSYAITLYTISDKFFHILNEKKYEKYTNSEWLILKTYLKNHTLGVKKLLRENAFIEKAKNILYEKNSSARGWTVRTEA